jgi:hypothetical protein
VNLCIADLKFVRKSVTESTNDKRAVLSSPMRLFIFKFSSETRRVVD